MAKRILTQDEVTHLIHLLQEQFAHQSAVRQSESLAELIQFPKIPPSLSESLVYHQFHTGALLGLPVEARLSTSGGDLEIPVEGGTYAKVEVKGTGESAFQFLSDKDLDAHLLLWVHFGSAFRQPISATFDVYVVVKPRSYISGPRKITLQALSDLASGQVARIEFEVAHPFKRPSPRQTT